MLSYETINDSLVLYSINNNYEGFYVFDQPYQKITTILYHSFKNGTYKTFNASDGPLWLYLYKDDLKYDISISCVIKEERTFNK